MDKTSSLEKNSELHGLFEVLRKSRNKLLTIFDMFPDGIIMLDEKFKIIHINQSRAHFLGKEPKDLIGRTCYSEFFNRDSECVDCPVAKSFKTGKKETSIMLQNSIGGVEFIFEVSAFPQQDDSGKFFSAIEITRDITEQKILEERLFQSEKLAFLGEMAAGMGHELLTPITGISMSIQDISRDLKEDSPHHDTFGMILSELERMDIFIRQLLKIAKPAPLVLSLVNIHKDILERVLFLLRDVTRTSRFKVVRRYSSSLPLIRLDQGQVISVFINIIFNALKAMKGESNGVLVVSTRLVSVEEDRQYTCLAGNNDKNEELKTRQMLEVKIKDNGCGIPPEDLPKIFEPFFSRLEGGFGLGLATTKKIVKKHRGEILVESEFGVGTTFTVNLPCLDAEE